MKELAAGWAVAQGREPEPLAAEWSTVFAVQDLVGHPEALWEFILAAEPLCGTQRARTTLAAGPLEDLIQAHGATYIDRIESQAKSCCSFAELLSGVWVPAGGDPVTLRYKALGCDQVQPSA